MCNIKLYHETTCCAAAAAHLLAELFDASHSIITQLVFAVSLFCLLQQHFQGDTLWFSLSLSRELLPYTRCHANSLILACMPSFSQPALLCRRISEQKYSYPPHGNPSVTVTNVLSVSELGILTNRCAQNSDILQRLNKVKCMNQTGSFYALLHHSEVSYRSSLITTELCSDIRNMYNPDG